MDTSITQQHSSIAQRMPGAASGWRSAFSRRGQAAGQEQSPRFVSLARTIAVRGAVSVVVATGVILGVFYSMAASQQEQDAAQFAAAKAEVIARSLDVFSQTIRVNTENAYGIFRRQFGATLELADEGTGLLVDNGNIVNGNTAQVDSFAEGYAGGNATVFVVQGEDFRRVTTSVKREDGSRAVGTLLDRRSPAYAAMREGKTYVGATVLFGHPFMTVYEPIRDSTGRTVAALYIGLDIHKQQTSLAEAVAKTRIFETGGLYVVNPGADPAAASLVFHPTAAGQKLSEVLREQPEAWLQRITSAGSSWLDNAPAVLKPGATERRYASVTRSEATGWLVIAEVPAAEAMASLYRELTWIGGFIALAAVLLGAGLVFFVKRMLNPLGQLSASVQEIGRGDLSTPLESDRRDEIGVITRELESMRVNLAEVVGAVRVGTDTIATASSQIAAGNVDLSSRTEEQASSLEETASSMEELTSTVKQNADNARQANQLAVAASEVAIKGGAVVGEVVATLSAISESSSRIVAILSVIDGIAFQTNILALNAAVEAARAGEQGRGFAVVAAEVRSLAQRSAAAAKEIKLLIDDSVEKVATGGTLVETAGSTMDEVVARVRRVTDIMGEITAASQEQSAGIEQVNQAITQMDQVTQQNAALVEEAAAAADSMQRQAGELARMVAVFKLAAARSVQPKARAVRADPAPRHAPLPQESVPAARQPRTPASPGTHRPGYAKAAAAKDVQPERKLVAAGGGAGEWEEF